MTCHVFVCDISCLFVCVFVHAFVIAIATDVQIRDEVMVFEGGNEAFSCTSTLGTTVEWVVNGTLLEEPYPVGVTAESFTTGGNLNFNNVPLDYNGTSVQCIATTGGNVRRTNIGTLLVQGK